MKPKIRYEFKYLISGQKARQIEECFKKFGLEREKPSSGQGTVCSLYFDTPGLNDYYDKIGGISDRHKLRVRIYADDFNDPKGPVWLEIKNKSDMSIFKKREPLTAAGWKNFCRQGEKFFPCHLPKSENSSAFFYHFLAGAYRPNVVVRYKRKAYSGNFITPFRFTLDSEMEACKWRDFRYNMNTAPIEKGKVILEIKFFDALPWWFQDLVRRFGLKRQPFSKYARAVEAVSRFNKLAK